MSRIAETFSRIRSSHQPGLVAYVTAGDPNLQRTSEILAGTTQQAAGRKSKPQPSRRR